MPFPPVPNEVRAIAHYLKVAEEHDERNIVVAYWSRMYACQIAMKIVPGKKSPEVSALLVAIMDWLEKTKAENREVDGITDEVSAQAIIEEYILQLFTYADQQDRAEIFNKNTVKAFYTTGILLDVLQQFSQLTEDLQDKRKYAKWKAAYIHHCLKIGDVPMPGPPIDETANRNAPKEESDDASADENPTTAANIMDNDDGNNASVLPTPSVTPTPAPSSVPLKPQASETSVASSSSGTTLSAQQMDKAQKYCKWATSALNYDDVNTAVDNLQKALELLQFGRDT